MTPDDSIQAPFDTDEDTQNSSRLEPAGDSGGDELNAQLTDDEAAELSELTQPYVGQWNKLISTTNWEKGQIISEWREALIESGVDSTQYSDEAWARRVGGVTAPHSTLR